MIGKRQLLTLIALTLTAFSVLLPTTLAHAQTETVLYNFCSDPGCTDGSFPSSSLTTDGKGNFYGTTRGGGAAGDGTVFEVSPNGNGGWNETVLYSFCSAPNCADGFEPYYSYVIFDTAGNLYGTTAGGGSNGNGVVWELSPGGGSWKETVLYSFGAKSGYPVNGLIMDAEGNLYGTTYDNDGLGTVFELTSSDGGWAQEVIYTYSSDDDTGSYAGLTMDAVGDIFSTSDSTVFELSPNGNGDWTPTVIYTLGAEALPAGAPVFDHAGNLYGATSDGGAKDRGTVYRLTRKKNGKWTKKILYAFNGGDGYHPVDGLVLDSAGNIYGTTLLGGDGYGRHSYGNGVVFELVAPVGKGTYTENILWYFNGTDGSGPEDSVILDGAGNLYGTTLYGGIESCNFGVGCGVVFEVTP
jgi:uncharacterized repeat protein (TIGR03803 family)